LRVKALAKNYGFGYGQVTYPQAFAQGKFSPEYLILCYNNFLFFSGVAMPDEVKKITPLRAGEGVINLAIGWSAAAAKALRPMLRETPGHAVTAESQERQVGSILSDFVTQNFPFDKRLELVRARETSPFLYVAGVILDPQQKSIVVLSGILRHFADGAKNEDVMTLTPQRIADPVGRPAVATSELPALTPK
jgi:hypothetical protein